MMKKLLVLLFAAASLPCMAQSVSYQWHKVKIDASRTGVGVPSVSDVHEKIGTVENGVYYAPNGRRFRSGCTPLVAERMLAAQPAMAEMKAVVGHASMDLVKKAPESALSNLIVDCVMTKAAAATGRKVDVGIMNFGGIRVDLFKGDILMDDVVSMLPFTNYICYLEVRGRDLRRLFSEMAARKVQVIGGARIVVDGGQLESVVIDGAPLDDNKVYGVATIDFLLDGGDGISVARNALSLVRTDVLVREAFMDYLARLREKGKSLEYSTDGRVTIK